MESPEVVVGWRKVGEDFSIRNHLPVVFNPFDPTKGGGHREESMRRRKDLTIGPDPSPPRQGVGL